MPGPALCPHKLNPIACLQCFHTKGAPVPKTPVEVRQQTAPQAAPMGSGHRGADAGTIDETGLWIPPKHPSVCDKQDKLPPGMKKS